MTSCRMQCLWTPPRRPRHQPLQAHTLPQSPTSSAATPTAASCLCARGCRCVGTQSAGVAGFCSCATDLYRKMHDAQLTMMTAQLPGLPPDHARSLQSQLPRSRRCSWHTVLPAVPSACWQGARCLQTGDCPRLCSFGMCCVSFTVDVKLDRPLLCTVSRPKCGDLEPGCAADPLLVICSTAWQPGVGIVPGCSSADAAAAA